MRELREFATVGVLLAVVVLVSPGVLSRAGHAARSGAAPAAAALPDALDRLPPTAAGPFAMPPAVARVDALQSTGRPADAWLAYRLLAACATAREQAFASGPAGFQTVVAPASPGACDGLEQRQVEQRVEWLRLAIDAHVRGAAADVVAQGPQGQPISGVWNDPRYADWKRASVALVEQAAGDGDSAALAALARLAFAGALAADEGEAAVRYGIAWADAIAAGDPVLARDAEARARFLAQARAGILRHAPFLAPERAAAAITAGHALGQRFAGD